MPRSASLRLALAASLLAATSTAAQAQTRTWNFADNTAPGSCAQVTAGGTNNVGNVWGCSEQPSGTATSLLVSAYSTSGFTSASTISASAITPQGAYGIGVGSAAEGGSTAPTTGGAHAIDNNTGGGSDLLVFQFLTGPQTLRSVELGWTGTDADFQVLRWTGAGAPGLAANVGSALSSGWQLVTTRAGAGTGTYTVNDGSLAASYWAVSAYNPAWGASGTGLVVEGNDQFKVKGLTATQAAVVPEPSTYALMATGLAALAGAARRRRTA